jgi:alpha-tubulin suppressor-like RCC1 family protein
LNVNTPTQVSGITTANHILTGNGHACASLSGGGVKCWGNNWAGQLGDNSTTASNTPVTVSGLGGSAIASLAGGLEHSCAVLTDGTVKCWGASWWGELGDSGGNYGGSTTPVSVTGITNATAISGNVQTYCALLSTGAVKCWGRGDYGQLGDGTSTVSTSVPVTVSGVSSATSISVGAYSACALISGGTVKCWGSNNYGQIGSMNYSASPVTAVLP